MKEKQLHAYEEVDELLNSAKFSQAIEKMSPWSKIWLNQFYQAYPHRYKILRHEGFDKFWAERREALNATITFVAQKQVLDIDFVLGYGFYLFALGSKEKRSEKKFIDYLKLALHFHSIHAAQSHLHELLINNDEDKVKKIETLAALLYNWESLAAKHGTPGYLLLANGYLHLVKISSELNDQESYKTACFYLWKNLIQAELDEPQSKASIHNTYFGQGLKLSNPAQLDTIDKIKDKASQFILDESIKLRAEKKAKSLIDEASQTPVLIWLQTKNKGAPKKESGKIKPEDPSSMSRF